MPTLLAIETATEACSAALLYQGQLLERFQVAPREHNQLILPFCEALLAEAGIAVSALDAIAFGRGPGSFTGVRIATGVVQGIAFARDLPVVPISTLATLAQGALTHQRQGAIVAAIDARMGEIYTGNFELGEGALVTALGEEWVCLPEAMVLPAGRGGWWGVGSGFGSYAKRLGAQCGSLLEGYDGQALPRARCTAQLAAAAWARGEAVAAEAALPVYLRDNVAAKAAAQRPN